MAYFQSATAEAKQGNNIFAMLTPRCHLFCVARNRGKTNSKKGRISFQRAAANKGTIFGNQTFNVLVTARVYATYGYLLNNYSYLLS